jgi:transporter family protein
MRWAQAFSSWTFWALFSAVRGNDGHFAVGMKTSIPTLPLLRTIVVLVSLALILSPRANISPGIDFRQELLFLLLSGWPRRIVDLLLPRKGRPASLVAPVDKLSVVLVAVLGVILLGENSTCANGAESA